jgi:hypothetical protein
LWLQVLPLAHAFTLAEVGGKVVIGRPLDITVRVQADTSEEVSAACVTAEVLYGDARQSNVNTSVLVNRTDATSSTLRVQVNAFVDEPVVTLVVRATCGTTTQRSYVLLAEFPTVANTARVAAAAIQTPSASPVLVLPPKEVVKTDTAEVASVAKPADSRKTTHKPHAASLQAKVPAAVPATSTVVALSAKRAKVARAAGKSVLKLDPLDMFSDRLDLIDSPMVFASSEDALLQNQKVVSLENDVKILRALAATNDAKLSQLRVQLQDAQAGQVPVWLIYGIGLLLLACCSVLGWMLWQQRRLAQEKIHAEWWNEVTNDARADAMDQPFVADLNPKVEQPTEDMPLAPLAVPNVVMQTQPSVTKKTVEVDLDLDQVMPDEQLHGSFEFNTISAPFEANSIRHISVEPILDIRQQAEFFVSLGQSERALSILKKQIVESIEPNPLVYLDLLALYQTLGLKTDFRECCVAFHQLFNGVIPDFPAFNAQGRGIEDYPEVLSKLIPLWPRTDALVFLSACIFHDLHVQPRQTFDLAAFRDLLMLHAIVEDLAPDALAPDLDFSDTIR